MKYAPTFGRSRLITAATALLALAALLQTPLSQAADDDDTVNLSGDWAGELNVFTEVLEVVFHVEDKGNGNISATVSVPKKSELPIPVNTFTREGRDINITVDTLDGKYSGRINGKADRMRGDWTTGEYTLGLDLELVEGGFTQERPQTPKPPFPYTIEEVNFANPFAKNRLSGTLTLPKTRPAKGHPAVILVSDNGPHNRDAEASDHRPFAVLADYLTRQGVAVLRYDDRGVGDSTGEHRFGITRDFATDAWSAVDFLSKRQDIDGARIGIIGHGEGALIAAMVAEKRDDIAFMVMLAGPGLRGDATLLTQTEALARASGVGNDTRALIIEFSSALYAVLVGDPVAAAAEAGRLGGELEKRIAALPAEDAKKLGEVGLVLDKQIKSLESPWFGRYVGHDPGPGLEALSCPVLALNGENDLEIPADIHLAAIERQLKKGGNKDFEIRKLKGLNHRFQEADNGAPSLYGTFDETFSPSALRVIGAWLKEHVR